MNCVLGVDVGTGSARAGLFSTEGALLGRGVCKIRAWTPKPNFAQQSSADIWESVSSAVRAALERFPD